MSKTSVFIYGSCVSRDTFEHFDPDQFELVRYVARQSALSAYTRPVTLVEPPALESDFQRRMVAGDFASSLQALIPEAAPRTDLVLVDLTDERLGAYVLPDGSVVTRSPELIQSGAEQHLPPGSQHLPFGSEQHLQYWSQGIAAVGELIRQHMPRAAVVLLDVPWAERSETGTATPESFGVGAREANPVFRAYVRVAADALRAEVVSVDPSQVTSSPRHPWGDAPFHYSEQVYVDLVRRLTGTDGRTVWGVQPTETSAPPSGDTRRVARASIRERSAAPRASGSTAAATTTAGSATLVGGPNFLVAGAQHSGAEWLAKQLGQHPDVFVATGKGSGYFNRPARIKSQEETEAYLKAFADGQGARWRGDCTPEYFWHSAGSAFGPKKPNTAEQVKGLLPADTPIVLVLREPTSRAMSAYWHHFSIGRFNLPTSVFQLPNGLGVIDLGFYGRHYQQWARSLTPERLHVILYDDLVADPRGTVRSVASTLGLPGDQFQVTGSPRAATAPRPWVRTFQQKGTVTAQEVAALHELYRNDVDRLEGLVGRDLSAWRNRGAVIRANTHGPKPKG